MTKVVEYTPQPEKAGQVAPNGGRYATAEDVREHPTAVVGVTILGGEEPPMKA